MHNAAEEDVSAHDASAGYFAGWNQCKGVMQTVRRKVHALRASALALPAGGRGGRQRGPQKDQARSVMNQSCSDIAVKKETRDKLG